MRSFWSCPSCRRKVPETEETCRCGFQRSQAAGLATQAPKRSRDLLNSWEVVGLLVVLVGALGYGVFSFFRHSRPRPIVPLLGYVDARPSPKPSPTPRAPSPAPRR